MTVATFKKPMLSKKVHAQPQQPQCSSIQHYCSSNLRLPKNSLKRL